MAVCKHGRPSPAVCFDCDGPDDDTVSPLAPPRPIAHVIAKRGGGKCDGSGGRAQEACMNHWYSSRF